MNSVRQQIVLDVQWSDAPDDVIKETRQLWRDYDNLSNDNSIYKFGEDDWTWDENNPNWSAGDGEQPTSYPAIEKWLITNKVKIGESVWIHWWW